MVDGPLDECQACVYQISNGDLVIDGEYTNYSAGGGSTETVTLSSADVSTYDTDAGNLGLPDDRPRAELGMREFRAMIPARCGY